MYTSIVVGTDGTSTANSAVTSAIGLAQATGARLHVVCAYNTAQASTAVAAAAGLATIGVEEIDRGAREHTFSVLDDAKGRAAAAGVDIATHACIGSPAESIITVAEDERADLIVVGNRGMQGARRVLGSVPNHISHHSPCSILIVRTT